MPWPDSTSITAAPEELKIDAVLVDEALHGQAAGEIRRRFSMSTNVLSHDWLRVQRPYRGSGMSHVLLNQAFPFYRDLGLVAVAIHAALETGRWHWARLGFDFAPTSRPVVETWATVCLAALGQPLLPTGFAASELALLGSAPSGETASFADLLGALEREVERRLADPATASAIQQFIAYCDGRLEGEMSRPTLDKDRLRAIADANGFGYESDAALGKVVMLAGPDWWGYFDLADTAAQAVFDAEFRRRFASR